MNKPAVLSLILLCGAASVFAQVTNHIPLEDLRHLHLPDVALKSVRSVLPDPKRNPKAAAYVEVKGSIGGHIQFELLLPEAWNERFVMGGGGGFVGTIQNAARDSVNLGYATAGTDTGHESQPVYKAEWAFNNLEAQLNFGYLAVHRTAEVAQALIRAYYRSAPALSYFVGCSRGGGQGMMEAQRYPQDFDGIVAGAPAFNWTGFAATSIAIAQALYPNPGQLDHPALDKAALQKLQQGVLEQCDARGYCRLYMLPGCLHCGGGPGATEVDWLSVIVDWVERNQVPERLIATKSDRGKAVMTRPLYPYPKSAIYKGSGDSNSADSFVLKPPSTGVTR